VQVKRLQNELNEAKSQVTVANFSMENEIEMERQRRNKDLTSQRMKFEGLYLKNFLCVLIGMQILPLDFVLCRCDAKYAHETRNGNAAASFC